MPVGYFLPALAICIIIVGGLLWISTITRGSPVRALTISCFGVHLVIGFAIFNVAGLFSPDATLYDTQATQVVAYWTGASAVPPDVTPGKDGWPSLLALIYRLVGQYPAVGIAVNALLSAFCVWLIYRAARLLHATPASAKRVTYFAFLPVLLFWGSLLLREAGMWCFSLMAVNGLLGIIDRSSKRKSLMLLIVGSVGAVEFRASAGIILLASAAVAVVFVVRSSVAVRVFVVLSGLAFLPAMLNFINSAGYTDTETINHAKSSLAASHSGFESSSLSSLPLGVLRALFGPFPWELVSLSPLYALDWICWIVVLVIALRRLRKFGARWIFAGPAASLLLALAITSGNYGTLIRLRATALVLLIPILALAPTNSRRASSSETTEAVFFRRSTRGNATLHSPSRARSVCSSRTSH